MTRIVRTVQIDAPIERVWEIIADFGGVWRYNPNVTTSSSTSEANRGVGATRHCDLAPIGSIEERILDWHDGRGYRLEIYDGEKVPPFVTAEAELILEPDGEGTRFTGVLEYSLRYGPLGLLMDRLFARRQFSTGWTRFAAGLKLHAETGRQVDGPKDVPLEAVEIAA